MIIALRTKLILIIDLSPEVTGIILHHFAFVKKGDIRSCQPKLLEA